MLCEICGSKTRINYGDANTVLCENCTSINKEVGYTLKKVAPADEISNSLLAKCESCSHQFSKRAAACPKCGWKPQIKCQICQQKILFDSTVCPECGDPRPFENENVAKREKEFKVRTREESANSNIGPTKESETHTQPSQPAQSVNGASISKLSMFLLGGAFSTFGTTISTAYRKTHISRYDYSTVEEYARGHGLNAGLSAAIGLGIGMAISIVIDKQTTNKTHRLIAKWAAFIIGFLVYSLIYIAVGG